MSQGARSLALAAALLMSACSRRDKDVGRADAAVAAAPAPAGAVVLHAHRTTAPVHLDGELKEADWHAAERTGPLIDAEGNPGRPFSDVMALVDDDTLFLGLYAADQDIEAHVIEHDGPVWTDDSFLLRFVPPGAEASPFAVDVSATGVIAAGGFKLGGGGDSCW
jgi:hypothetical protein